VKYNTKKTSPTHKITGTPPPIDISAPAKKKVPMSYILGAAAVLLLIVAGYFFMQGSGKTEPPRDDKTNTVEFSVIVKLAEARQKDSLHNYLGRTVTGDIDTNFDFGVYMISEKNLFVSKPNAEGTGETFATQTKPVRENLSGSTDPLKKEKKDSSDARIKLDNLFKKYGGDLKGHDWCTKNCPNDSIQESCSKQISKAKKEYDRFCRTLEKKRSGQ
jgi:hypothetical protein